MRMTKNKANFVDVSQIQIGMFIELDLGWMSHPFPTGSFKVTSSKQIEIIAGLGLTRVRYVPEKCDVLPPHHEHDLTGKPVGSPPSANPTPTPTPTPTASKTDEYEQSLRAQHAKTLLTQQRSMVVCERRFGEALRQYRKTVEILPTQAQLAAEQCRQLVSGYVGEMMNGESAIRLLTETAGEKSSMHPVNVTVLALLLGKALKLTPTELLDLGMAAFLHDIGKVQLPDRVRWLDDSFTPIETRAYQEHVWQSVQTAKAMGLAEPCVLAISQHHELVDGSGFPLRLHGELLTGMGKILALVNRYDNLCNATRPSASVTPHEALGLIFSQYKSRFDPVVLGAFIRMMGVYPPGTVVQLTDSRYAIVVSVNASLPQKPGIVVYEPGKSRLDTLILEMEHTPNISIRRSLNPAGLPDAARDFLAPRQRMAYFFERVVDSALPKDSP